MPELITFGAWNTWSHAAAFTTPPDTLAIALNLDRRKEGQVGPRDGLQRPSTWDGIMDYPGTLVTGAANTGQFGKPIRTLIPHDTSIKDGPGLTFDESS